MRAVLPSLRWMTSHKMAGSASHRALAQAFLNHVPVAQRQSALDDLSGQLMNQDHQDAQTEANSVARLVVEILRVEKSVRWLSNDASWQN
jgi:hypothetical protein